MKWLFIIGRERGLEDYKWTEAAFEWTVCIGRECVLGVASSYETASGLDFEE